ncbi:MAG: ATP-binding protein [Candidatus Omnitrophica bacterium]|nr:ATP-binding protein [Candidatus Omnitrophota bacterium]
MNVELDSARKANILIVDDRPEGLLTLEAVLSSKKYNLVKATSGSEALSHILYYDFAVILLDVQMPELDGFETAKLIREHQRSKETPIIFVTAINKETSHIYRGYEAGAVDYIFKPLDPIILQSKVDVFVDLFNKNLKIKYQAELLHEMEVREKERQMVELEKESLRRYVNLADAVPHIIIKIQKDGRIEYSNQRWCDYTGIHYELNHWKNWQWVVHPQDRRQLLVFWLRSHREGCLNFQIQVRIRRAKDGLYRWHLARFVAEFRNQELIGWIGTGTDIDDLKKSEQRLQSLSESLDRSNRELEQFAFVASHDLQEPLRIISSYLDLLNLKYKDKLDDDAREFIAVTKDAASRAQKLILDLLEYARVGIKKMEFNEVNFESVFNQVLQNFSLLIKERGAEIVHTPLPTLIADHLQMVQIFQNLISNSLKYCDHAPRIEIKAEKKSKEWIFSFKDNGIGIDSQYYDRIFVIFQRLHTMTQYQGTGIGLALCKKIVERHRGKIWVESMPQQGTTFYFSIPEISIEKNQIQSEYAYR